VRERCEGMCSDSCVGGRFHTKVFFFFKALILSETTDTVYVGCSGWVVVSILTGEIWSKQQAPQTARGGQRATTDPPDNSLTFICLQSTSEPMCAILDIYWKKYIRRRMRGGDRIKGPTHGNVFTLPSLYGRGRGADVAAGRLHSQTESTFTPQGR
jgi:hypothetical protein